jgi:hypothetical protein
MIQLSFIKGILFSLNFPSFAVKIHHTGHKVVKGTTISIAVRHE